MNIIESFINLIEDTNQIFVIKCMVKYSSYKIFYLYMITRNSAFQNAFYMIHFCWYNQTFFLMHY